MNNANYLLEHIFNLNKDKYKTIGEKTLNY